MIRNKIPVLIVALGLIVFVAGCSKPTGNQNASANANVSTTNLKEEPKMKELDHDNLEYQGSPGEKVTIRITAQGTTHMVTYKLDGGATQVLKQGDPIEFDLKNVSGQRTDLEVTIDGDHEGSYEMVIENVTNCENDAQHIGKCVRTRRVPPKKVSLFAFFVA